MKKLLIFAILLYAIQLSSQTYFQKINNGIVASDTGSYSNAAWGDYNNDGLLDLVVVPWNDGCWGCRSPIQFYKNNGDGTFTHGSSILVDQVLSCIGVAWGDYDNDGRLDLIVTRYFNQTNLLFHNEGNGDFSLISTGVVATETASSSSAAWCDYDRDGNLDLFISHGQNQNNALYHNNGNGTFVKITAGPIVNDGGDSRGCAWGDYNNDGWPDLFVANYGNQNNFLYQNNGDGTFTKVTNIAPLNLPGYGEECHWLDYDNDGWLDLYVTYNAANNRLYHNNHNGTFSLTTLAPSQEWGWSYNTTIADFDNDGWVDIFVAKRNQNGYFTSNALFKNSNGNFFTKITSDPVSQDGGISVSGVFGDFDSDGKMDLFVANGSSGFGTRNFFYKNITSNTGNYVTVKLRGCELNKSAIGSRIKIVTGANKQLQEVSGGNGSQGMLWQHFGLGSATTIDSIIVYFTTGTVVTRTNVPANQIIEITDGNCPVGIINNEIPVKYELEQNYPNPFNPSTKIKYSLLKNSNVKLIIYDIMGRFIKYLVNESQPFGSYEYEFDGINLSSGIYIYKLEAGDFTDTKKMVLLK